MDIRNGLISAYNGISASLGTSNAFDIYKSTTGYVKIFNNGRAWFGSGTPVDGGFQMDINGTARVSGNTVISAGNLSIFTTNTPRRINLQVANGSKAAAIGIESGGSIHSVVGIDTSGTDFLQVASKTGISFYSNSTIGDVVTDPTNERMRLTTAGRLLLGLTSESTFLLDVNGTARVSGNMTIAGILTVDKIIGGTATSATGNYSLAYGVQSQSSGAYSLAFGRQARADSELSFALGGRPRTYLWGQFAQSSVLFSYGNYAPFYGIAQASTLTPYRINASLLSGASFNLSLDGSGTLNLIIPDGDNRVWNVVVESIAVIDSISGTATGVSVGDVYIETKKLLFKRRSGTSSIVGSVDTSGVKSDTSMTTAAFTITAGGSQQMEITFTAPTFAGGGSVFCKVMSKVSLVELTYA